MRLGGDEGPPHTAGRCSFSFDVDGAFRVDSFYIEVDIECYIVGTSIGCWRDLESRRKPMVWGELGRARFRIFLREFYSTSMYSMVLDGRHVDDRSSRALGPEGTEVQETSAETKTHFRTSKVDKT